MVWTGVKGSGVFQLANDSFVQLTDPTVDHLLRDPHCILVDQRSRIWVGAGDDSMLCREDGNWRRYRIPRNLARPYIGVLAEEVDGTVWAGSVSEGLIQYKEGKLTTVNASSGLPDNLISALTVDREGNLWVGTGAGLTRVRRKELLALGPNDGLGYGAVRGLAEIEPGKLWVAQPGNSVYLWSGRNFTPNGGMSRQSGLGEISALLRTRNGACWVATDDGVLCFPDPANPAVEPGPRALAGLSVLALAEDRAGKLWAGTKEGQLWVFQADAWAASRSPCA